MPIDQLELDIRAEQIKQLTETTVRLRQELETSQEALQAADSEVVLVKVLLSKILWGMADVDLAKVKFEQHKGRAWRYIRHEKENEEA